MTPPGSATHQRPATASLLKRLYTGTGAFNIIGRKRLFFTITAILLVISLSGIIFRGFTFGIDFTGGTRVELPAAHISPDEAERVFSESSGVSPATVQVVGTGAASSIQIRSESLDEGQIRAVELAFHTSLNESSDTSAQHQVSVSAVSETWGGRVTEKAVLALAVFLVLVFAYISLRFEWHMALAAIAAVIVDLAVTSGVYALVGFEVSPATVIGLLTIMGYSLYDTVVVFDKIQENTRNVAKQTKHTYAELANLGVNQTLMRSINTSLTSALPIISLLLVAVWMLGVGTLKDLALVQLVGVVVGTYSSPFFAAPLLVYMKERAEEIKTHTMKVMEARSA
ncbi:protein translocase subunit SecF [Hoyosella sp. YIM 151337]|uniref:protein translocase subunit SecF n=1 Tax=Hoyosella sp. YIM 151337 TaxID=2992742 RepID=UPI002235F994|nr:protein translocase subunit SecF [Hoyosella sp. YIM 151337]MCW4353440.1 protein translocase subunit SecF [Hoyosella sp. YIM 151337]